MRMLQFVYLLRRKMCYNQGNSRKGRNGYAWSWWTSRWSRRPRWARRAARWYGWSRPHGRSWRSHGRTRRPRWAQSSSAAPAAHEHGRLEPRRYGAALLWRRSRLLRMRLCRAADGAGGHGRCGHCHGAAVTEAAGAMPLRRTRDLYLPRCGGKGDA